MKKYENIDPSKIKTTLYAYIVEQERKERMRKAKKKAKQ